MGALKNMRRDRCDCAAGDDGIHLHGRMPLISGRDRPKLAVCIYHKPEDMITLPQYIRSLVPEYRSYVRSYSNADNEMVLYAVL